MKSAEIHVLSDEIINKIAAGEVIERPASAVKELIENAIDAGASRIQVSIEEGGKKKIQVSDNGKGMNAADLDLCYLRHTTSKLFSADDLFHLHTNGFRGEAVASIAAVSKLTITSATDDGDSGRILLEGGNVVEKQDVQASRGTTFLVENLFYNTPVRRNFLSSETAESTRILDVVLKTAIAHPDIRFDYKVGEKTVFTGVPGELRNRIAEAIGSKIAKVLLPVDYTEAGVHVWGYVSPTTETNGKRNHQFLFIRNRPIESKMVSKAVQQAYEPYGAQCKPVSVLFLDMPDMEFDVNVHPAKREVRFANQNLVFLVVSHAIRDTFTKDMEANSPLIDLSEEIAGTGKTELQDNTPKVPYGFEEPIFKPAANPAPSFSTKESSGDIPEMSNFPTTGFTYEKPRKSVQQNDLAQDLFSTPEAGKVISLEGKVNEVAEPAVQWTPPTFFQIANTYIAGDDSNGLLVIDQHAAHSRVLYEQALATLRNGSALDSQELLFPELLELSKLEVEALKSVEDQFKHLGFYIEHFGGETYQIRAIPSALPLSRAIKAVKDFLDSIGDEGKGEGDMVKIQDTIAKAWASTNAYQAGDKLKPEEMAALVSQLMLTEEPLKSPYGHPTLLRFTLDELAKKFKR
ncbi:DNA mismatch repair protein MutL [Fibrobacter sp. UWT2]|uniref:DNA mismatch repair endonuclease MutL n=1 Tax=Fibrobacter sp. UWT2 TaxID=1896224 RepID=UPI000915706E|nr:DNA mismatch repair endonuclease MutL [Fibrobacter sp. UWT2]SHK71881.1 DNA mismatch repair protein MutL [Fibrobacter sp. UWT2]